MIGLDDVTVRAGSFRLEGVSAAVPRGAWVTLTGPVGSGKSTLLEAVAGVRPVAEGRVHLNGRDVTQEPPEARDVAWVPQDVALLTSRTALEQVALPLRLRGASDAEERATALAALWGLTDWMDRRPGRLSGGQRQLTAIVRAVAADPPVVLLDEPFSALDAVQRDRVSRSLRDWASESSRAVLHVTHSPGHAAEWATAAWRLEDGRILGTC